MNVFYLCKHAALPATPHFMMHQGSKIGKWALLPFVGKCALIFRFSDPQEHTQPGTCSHGVGQGPHGM